MKLASTLGSLVALGLATTAAQAATPSFGFVQEFAGVSANGDISADFYNSTTYPTHLRIGAFKGEILIDPNTTVTGTGMGYKYPINPNLAMYGKLYMNTGGGASITNITLGVSYSGTNGGLTYNANAEAYSATALPDTLLDLRGAAFYKLKTNKLGGNMSIGGEIDLQLSPSPTTTDIYAGLRWQPKPKLLVDAGLAASNAGTTVIATPAFVRLTLGL